MRLPPASCTLIAALALSTLEVRAAGPLDTPAGQAALAYTRQHLTPDQLVQAGRENDRLLGLQTACRTEYQATPMSMQVVTAVEFAPGSADPVKGSWSIRYRLTRCGDTKVYNALFVARDGAAPLVQPSFPGTSLANPVLLRDAMRQASLLARNLGPDKACKTLNMFDMQVSAPPHEVAEGGKVFKGVWNELWTFSQCGKPVEVTMRFTPSVDGSGIDFQAGLAAPSPAP